jgi:CheY-like chemotaxis protein
MNIAPKILIVEDDRTIHRLLARLLEHSGYTVVSAFTLKEAERLFYEHPDLSLISWDGRVPEVEGARIDLDAEPTLQLVRKIRQLFPGPMIAA